MAAARTGSCGCSGGGGSCATASSSSARSIGSPAPQWIPWQPHRDGNRVGGDTSVARDTWHRRARRSLFEPSLPKEAARIDRSPARPGGAAPSDGARCFSGVTAPAPSCAYTHSRTLVQGELGLERTNRPSVRAVQRQRHGALACLNGAHRLRVASTCAPVERPHSGKAYRSSVGVAGSATGPQERVRPTKQLLGREMRSRASERPTCTPLPPRPLQ